MKPESWRGRLPLIASVLAAALLPLVVSIASREGGAGSVAKPAPWPATARHAASAVDPGGPSWSGVPDLSRLGSSATGARTFALVRPPESLAEKSPVEAQDAASPAFDRRPETFPETTLEGAGSASKRSASDFDCLIEPNVLVQLGSPVEGVIQSILVDRSDFVEAGQVLVELEAGVEVATVDLARARAKMMAEVRSRETAAAREQRRQQRMDSLYSQDAAPLELQDRVGTDARVAKFDLDQARERRQLASLELQQAIEVLKRRTLRSPITGYIVERKVSPGEKVDDQAILTIAQVDPLSVEVIVPSALFRQVSVGAKAEVTSELPEDLTHTATVTVVDRVIDAATGTFGVRLTLPNPGNDIPAGLRCRVRFLPETAH
jgi:RND family efflux transporter MFP subunit